jgi:serine/threonine protein kinase
MEGGTSEDQSLRKMDARQSKTFAESFAFCGTPNDGILGEGSFGTIVRRAKEIESGDEFAVKCIKMKQLASKARDDVRREIAIHHPCLLQTFLTFEEKGDVFMVTELMRGGDMFEHLVTKGTLTEKEAHLVMRCLVDGIRYLHERDIVHRDIKPENILVRDSGEELRVVLCDFGFAKKLPKTGGMRTGCGTENYAAPEIFLGKGYGKGVDIWALGVCLFLAVAGAHPFADETSASVSMYTKAAKGIIHFDPEVWSTLSEDFKDLETIMLLVDSSKRATIADVANHVWLSADNVA